MTKHIVLSFPEENVSAMAELLEDVAPETCRFIWEHLPVEGRTVHGMLSGAEIFTFFDPATPLKRENLVNLPLPGEMSPGSPVRAACSGIGVNIAQA